MFKITLANNEIITENKCSWNKLPWFPIKSFEFFIKKTPIIYLEGFEYYLYIQNKYYAIGRHENGLAGIDLLGKHNKKVYQFSIDFLKGHSAQRIGKWNEDTYCSLNWNPTTKTFFWGKPEQIDLKKWHIGVIGKPIIKRN